MRIGYTNLGNSPSTDHYNELNITSFFVTPGVHGIYPVHEKVDVYAKLGLSIILSDINQEERVSQQVPDSPTNQYSSSLKDWDIAPTLGAGVEWAAWESWALMFEYTFTRFSLQPVTSSDVNYTGMDYDAHNALLGVRYRFN